MQFHSHLRRPLLLFAPVTVSKYFMFHCEHACSKPRIAHWTNLGEDNKLNQRRCLLFLSLLHICRSYFCVFVTVQVLQFFLLHSKGRQYQPCN